MPCRAISRIRPPPRASRARAAQLLGGLDYLVNNAGAPWPRTPIPAADLDALSDEFWDRILRVNLHERVLDDPGVLPPSCANRAERWSTPCRSPRSAAAASSTAYATAKAALVGLTRELARGLAPGGRVNGIAPGLVNSNWECSFGDLDAAARATVPLGRVGEPGDYAEVIVYLCAGASYITGEVIPVTGGLRL